jgi:hypothetical protein
MFLELRRPLIVFVHHFYSKFEAGAAICHGIVIHVFVENKRCMLSVHLEPLPRSLEEIILSLPYQGSRKISMSKVSAALAYPIFCKKKFPKGEVRNPRKQSLTGVLQGINQEKRNGDCFFRKVTASRSLINQLYHTFYWARNIIREILEFIFARCVSSVPLWLSPLVFNQQNPFLPEPR